MNKNKDPFLQEFSDFLNSGNGNNSDNNDILMHQRDLTILEKKLKEKWKYSKEQMDDLRVIKEFLESKINNVDFDLSLDFHQLVWRLRKSWIIDDLKIVKSDTNKIVSDAVEILLKPKNEQIKDFYWTVLNRNGIDYYREAFFKRMKEQKIVKMVKYEEEMWKSIDLYCGLISLQRKTKEQKRKIRLIYSVYKEFIEDCLKEKI